MQLLQWLLWSSVLVAVTHASEVSKREAAPTRVVCYYTNWSVYRPGTAKFSPQNINPYLCTHLIYAFGGLSRENGLRPYDKYQDIEQGGYAKFTGLKTYNKQLKTLLAIGGWNEGSARFSSLVADEERRAEFVKNVVRFLRQNHFDGLDLDWEYPAFRDGGKPRDRGNYALLVQELREEFDREHSKTGRPRLLLTMAVPAGIEYIDKGYDIPKLNRYLDFMNILSYDYHSAFESSVNHHSPLYPMEEDNEYNFDTQLCIDYTVKHLIKLGADRDKLVLGIPTYGRSYTLFNADATGIGSPADGPGEQGDATREKGYLAYYEICENLETQDWQVEKPNPSAMGPYAYKDNQWVGYDDEDIVRLKAKYVSENGLGGIMFWAIDNDDFRGKCHGRPYPLIEAGKEAMFASNGLTNEVSETSGQTKKSSQRPRTNAGGGSAGRNRNRKRKNKNRSTTTTTTTRRTTTLSTTTPKYVTPEPPTTPDPGSDFKCKDEGFFPHPRDCKKYFWCLDSGPSNLGIVAHQFTCPSGLVFNKAADSCDYARNVICKNKPKAESTTTKPTAATTRSSTSAATIRTTTTTTTTTTTPPPPEEEEEEEYEEYEDEEEEGAPGGDEEDPKVIQELINLIKKLGGVEQLERQLQLQEKSSPEGTSGISRSLYNKVLGRTTSNLGRGASLYGATTPSTQEASTRYSSIFRNRPRGPQNEGLDETPTKFERPKYVTIQRNRSSTTTPEAEEDEEDLDDEDYIDDEEEEEEKPRVAKPETTRTSAREYVNIRRERPQKPEEPDVTTPKYITIQRHKSLPEEEVNEPVEAETPEATAVSLSGDDNSNNKDELPVPSQDTALENPPKEISTSKRPSRLNVINKKGRKDTETEQEVEKESEAPVVKTSPVIVTRPLARQRQPGTLFSPRQRQRTTTTPSTTITTTTATARAASTTRQPAAQRRVVKRRKFGPRGQSTTEQPQPASTSPAAEVLQTQEAAEIDTTARPSGKFAFPKRRVAAAGNDTTTSPTPLSDALVQPSALVEDTQDPGAAVTALPDLAHPAVAAIAHLATQQPPQDELATTVAAGEPSSEATSTEPAGPGTASTSLPTRPVRIPSARRFAGKSSSTAPTPTTAPALKRQPLKPRPFAKIASAGPRTPSSPTPPRAASVTPSRGTRPPLDYDYYDDASIAEAVPGSSKVKVHDDGYIECLDQGNFPHPYSCKKFISCAKMESGGLLGWEYTCPRQLSFDPVGGICNWSAGLGCKE